MKETLDTQCKFIYYHYDYDDDPFLITSLQGRGNQIRILLVVRSGWHNHSLVTTFLCDMMRALYSLKLQITNLVLVTFFGNIVICAKYPPVLLITNLCWVTWFATFSGISFSNCVFFIHNARTRDLS